MRPNVNQLWHYANKIARESESLGLGTRYPTVREAAIRFKCKQSDIEECAGEGIYEGDHYLGTSYYLVNYKVPLGDNFIEAY